jgi:hypothetical protein
MPEAKNDGRGAGQPTDGPSRGEPGSGGDLGASSQDEPGAGSSGTAGTPGKPELSPDPAEDTNERADQRATVLEPDGSETPRT